MEIYMIEDKVVSKGRYEMYKYVNDPLCKIENLQSRVQELEACLAFYADENKWKSVWDNQFNRYVCDINADHGRRARKALAGKDKT